jgi:hypothetical protein
MKAQHAKSRLDYGADGQLKGRLAGQHAPFNVVVTAPSSNHAMPNKNSTVTGGALGPYTERIDL